MLDFYDIRSRKTGTKSNPVIELYPELRVDHVKDLMVRGHAFYAVWDPDANMWSRNEYRVRDLIDRDIYKAAKSYDNGEPVIRKTMGAFSTGKWTEFQKYLKVMPDNYEKLDSHVTFADQHPEKKDYVSHKLPYSLDVGEPEAWNELIQTLYEPDEQDKIEWSIGSIFSGDSKKLQKFLVFYGSGGSGKSTMLNIIQQLFEGYWISFNAKELGMSNNTFALAPFSNDPLLAIQHDGDLSRIEDNTLLNSIVSHETMQVNEKFKAAYDIRPTTFLMMATNKPVKITDAKSGLIRRLIDVHPSGARIPANKYNNLVDKIPFELGKIANKCLQKYQDMGYHYYDTYVAQDMLEKTDVFYNFMEDNYLYFSTAEYVTLKSAWELYKNYVDESRERYAMPKFRFKDELKNYYKKFVHDTMHDGSRLINVYSGFRADKFFSRITDVGSSDETDDVGVGGSEIDKSLEDPTGKKGDDGKSPGWIILKEQESIFDRELADQPAQYANDAGTPLKVWADVKTKLKDLDSGKLHYINMPENYICIDFDLKGPDGKKSLALNVEAANKWPKTYAETSKSGQGLHLIYIYNGDIAALSRIYDKDIEVKVFNGNASLRRKLTVCNDIDISVISSGLPMKEVKKTINFEGFRSEQELRKKIEKNLNKEVHEFTKPSIDFIDKLLDEAYNQEGFDYDVRDLRNKVFMFAAMSTHNAVYCTKKVSKMKFCSKSFEQQKAEEPPESEPENYKSNDLVFFDVEVFPNLFVVVYKTSTSECIKMINPAPGEIEELLRFKLIGFNNRKYDNHILYGRLIGYSNIELYNLSQKIVSGDRNAMFGQAYNLSYADVYDFSSKKQSLKKFEIELGIHHQELGLPWDEPVPENKWELVAEYCCNDVIATQKTFEARHGDFVAREMLSAITGMSVNTPSNTLSARLIFEGDKNPQPQFNYVDLSKYFEGYKYEGGVSTYRGETVGEGGYVYAEPGMYGRALTLDVASMHPSSIIAMNLFGDKYTKRFKELLDARLYIKHGEYEKAKQLFGGKLSPYLTNKGDAKALSKALKIVINSVYGLTAAKFNNPFRDSRNVDNIVAKRGALFMIDLKHLVQEKGYTVIHVKTDSIKIKDPDDDILNFVIEYGRKWGYNFEVEHTWSKICLVNDAVLIGKHDSDDPDSPNEWEATGTQFQVPYVYKTLFSHEPITLDDMCETKSVQTALYLDLNEGLEEGEHNYQFVGRTGQFCPVIDGAGGGVLVRKKTEEQYNKQLEKWENEGRLKNKPMPGKFTSVGGTKGYRWMESEVVRNLDLKDKVDDSYYKTMVDSAVETISKYGDFEWFAA